MQEIDAPGYFSVRSRYYNARESKQYFFPLKSAGFYNKAMRSSHHQYQFPPNISRHLHTYGCLRLQPQGCSRIVLFFLSSTNRMLLLFLYFVILYARARSVVNILLRLLYPRFRRFFIKFCGCGFCRIFELTFSTKAFTTLYPFQGTTASTSHSYLVWQ